MSERGRMQLTDDVRRVLDALKRVDWPSALHRASVFARAIRGDQGLRDDTDRLERRAQSIKARLQRAMGGDEHE